MSETILRQKAFEIIDSGHPFDLTFVTADRRRGTGGKLITVKQWVKASTTVMPNHTPANTHAPKGNLGKNPDHAGNKTFNISHPNNRMIHMHKVHYRLMCVLNGKTIVS